MTILEGQRPRASAGPRSSLDRRRKTLLNSGRRLVRATEDLLGTGDRRAYEVGPDLGELVAQLDLLTSKVMDRLSAGRPARPATTLADLGRALVELQTFRSEVHDHDAHARLDRLAAVEAGLAPLRFSLNPDDLLHRACAVLVCCGGFDRALLSRVKDSTWRPWKAYAHTEGEGERHFRDWMAGAPDIPLDHLLLESEMVRRHAPALVEHPGDDPRVYRPLIEASGLTPYVAAPIMPTGRVIGFLHADKESGTVTELDRDILGAFAHGFGQIFERAVLLRRLQHQREQVREALITVENVLEDLATAELELTGRGADGTDGASAGLPGMPLRRPLEFTADRDSRLEALLTTRELEVLELMATGATNNRIAAQLVITDGTVKSHVKRILRKLHAANRSEAVVRYLRLTMGAPGGR
ncbi:MAG: LuxR family transcriptional regulator, regulator of acetate metabolism [Solirubrobacteraceae bacterium]|jgi:DNA-binding CsgD family transcriptional regulator|nr:LuxR family transcriptional regulator, regulator of acetate metabolism [Solirubrobacteraceae bacterium]